MLCCGNVNRSCVFLTSLILGNMKFLHITEDRNVVQTFNISGLLTSFNSLLSFFPSRTSKYSINHCSDLCYSEIFFKPKDKKLSFSLKTVPWNCLLASHQLVTSLKKKKIWYGHYPHPEKFSESHPDWHQLASFWLVADDHRQPMGLCMAGPPLQHSVILKAWVFFSRAVG